MKNNQIRSIKYNFVMNLILTASNFLFPLITFPYVSRVLQVEANGILAYVTSIVSYFSLIASLGIPTYGIRAAATVRDDKRKLSKVVQELLIINIVLVGFVLIIYFIMLFTVPSMLVYRELFYINAIGIILNVLGVNWFFQAIEQYDYITVRSIIFRIFSIALMFIFVHQPSDYIIYGLILVFSSAGSNILNFKRLFKYITLKKQDKYEFVPHFKPILILFAQSLVISIYTNLDLIMLGSIKDSYEVGLYTAATKLKLILLSIVNSLGNVLLPRMSYYAKRNMKEQFERITAQALNFTLFISFPLAVFFTLNAKESLFLLAGEQYLGAVLSMQFLTIAVIPIGITGILGIQVLTPLEKEKYLLISVIVGAVIDLLLNFILISSYGSSGAAFATMIAEFAVLFVQIYYTRDLLFKIAHQIVGIRYLFTVGISVLGMILVKSLQLSYFWLLCVEGIIFFGSYAVILVLLKDDFIINFLENFYKKLKKF
ncbi:flippase [Streptococcus mitis]|uniref:flippase n=1 Tax=Streptococcus mitis TaxID=28037 RepID=UPI00066CC903|nr:flippase [Streptococcus mitis]